MKNKILFAAILSLATQFVSARESGRFPDATPSRRATRRAAELKLTPDALDEIETAVSAIPVEGERYPESLARLTGRSERRRMEITRSSADTTQGPEGLVHRRRLPRSGRGADGRHRE